MKNLFCLLVILVILNLNESEAAIINLSPEENSPGYVITIKSENINDAYLYLSKRVSGKWENEDSALFTKGNDVVFKGSLECPEVLYLRLENSNRSIPFYAENSTITILPDFKNPDKTVVQGSSVHRELQLYESMFTELKQKEEELSKEYQEARKRRDDEKLSMLDEEFNKLSDREMEMNKKYVSDHSGSYISPYIIRSRMYYSLSLDELKRLVNGLDPSIGNSVYVKELKNHISVLEKVDIGMKFTDFSLPTPEGTRLSLSDITGKNYILIDFWASWCGPCRSENPNVVKLYNEYHDLGFEIIGVSLDNSRDKWLKAIKDDKLDWYHVSDLNGWGSLAGRIYGVNSIPHTVLLDPDGIIIAKNLRGDELREKLSELLK